MRIIIAAAICVAYLAAPASTAQVYTGRDLYGFCSTVGDDPAAFAMRVTCSTFVDGFFHGVIVTLGVQQEIQGKPTWMPICNTAVLNNEQVVAIFKKWARAHPKELADPAGWSLLAAMMAEYPCR